MSKGLELPCAQLELGKLGAAVAASCCGCRWSRAAVAASTFTRLLGLHPKIS